MNFAQQAMQSGFNVLLGTNGEPLNFRGLTVRGVVNRAPQDRVVRTPDFDPRDSSEIRIRTSAVSAIPRPGEEFTDEYGIGHRVQTVRRLGDFYTIRCVPDAPTLELVATETPEWFSTESGEGVQAA